MGNPRVYVKNVAHGSTQTDAFGSLAYILKTAIRRSPMNLPTIFVQIHKAIVSGSLQLPALPDVALRIREALRNPDIDLNGVAKIIQVDPGLTAYLIQVANSPVYRGSKHVDNLGVALSRLGLSATKNLAMSYAMLALYTSEHTVPRPMLRVLWQQSTRLAALASVLAKHCKGFDPDRALLAGLLQDIGCLPLLQASVRYPEFSTQPHQLLALFNRYAANVGATLLKSWHFDEDIVECARSRENWLRQGSPQADYADIVLVARLHSFAGTERLQQLPKMTDIPAFHKLPLGEITLKFSLKLLDEAKDHVAELQRAISGSV